MTRTSISCTLLVFLTAYHGYAWGSSDTVDCAYGTFAFPAKMKDGVYPHHYRPDRTVDMQHIAIEIKIDFPKQEIAGTVHLKVSPINDAIDRVRLDAVGLTIDRVLYDRNQDLEYDAIPDRDEVYIHLPEGAATRDSFELSVQYHGSPRRHFFWRDTDRDGELKTANMIFTLCEPVGASYWFPCLDYPSDRTSSEVIATVPKGFTSISNGDLTSRTVSADGQWETHHWLFAPEHVTYLISLVVGKFGVVHDTWRGIPVDYYCKPGMEEDARATMGNTPAMLDFYSRIFGVDYPYSKYAQVPVKDFPAAGMEHTTCTTMFEHIVKDPHALLGDDEDGLISHELVHQWFGDLLTCKSWPHLWLNEGFATYFQAVWTEHANGKDEFLCDLYGKAESYFHEAESYTRPIVTNQFESAGEMFDRHAYPKSAWVLHMLRNELGDALFYRAIQHYCRSHQNQLVDTDDFQNACETVSGKSLDRFFEQWVYRPGHPTLKIDWRWTDRDKSIHLTVKQTQTMEEGAPPFVFPLAVRIATETETLDKTFDVTRVEETFSFAVPDEPKSIDVNPDLTQLLQIEFDKSPAMLRYEAIHGKSPVTRLRAIQQLAKKDDPNREEILIKALQEDPFWWVQSEAVDVLAKLKTDDAKQALIESIHKENPKVRRAVATALGTFIRDDAVAKPLQTLLEKDESLIVAESAAGALGKSKAASAKTILQRNLKQESFADRIRQSALRGLGALEDPNVLSIVKKYAGKDNSTGVREEAILAVGQAGHYLDSTKQDEPLELLLDCLAEENDFIRRVAAEALGTLGNDGAVSRLNDVAQNDPDRRARQAAQSAADKIRQHDTELAKKNASRIDELLKKQETLEKQLQEMRGQLKEMKTE